MRLPLAYARRSFRLIIGLFLVWCGGVFAWIGGTTLQTERRYRDEAQALRGAVLARTLQPATEETSTRYEITYRVSLPDGSTLDRSAAVDVAEWERLEPGAPVDVQYLAGEPDSIRLAREPQIAANAAALGVGVTLVSAGLILAALGVRDVRRKTRLHRHGTPAHATVLSVEATNVKVNRRTQWRIRFSYRDHTGLERHGVSDYMDAGRAHNWRAGDSGVVHFDPDSPEQVLWLGHAPEQS